MKKKTKLLYDDEIDLVQLFKVIWNGKIKILLVTATLFLVGVGYSYQIPNSYLISLNITKNDNSVFDQVNFIYKLLENVPYTNQEIINKFNSELLDYEEFLLNIKNTKKLKENISNLPTDVQKKELLKYKNLLKIIKKNSDLKLNFEWDNIDEAKIILQDTINLTLINLEKSIYKDLDLIIQNKKKEFPLKNSYNLEFLKEQRRIAKELNISDIPYGYTGSPFYLRGYLAIDKEIESMKNYNDKKSKLIKQEINLLKKENISWVIYNINSIKVKSLKNTKLILFISIFLSFIFGVFYVLILNLFKSQSTLKKKI